jgi:hypothetical protein
MTLAWLQLSYRQTEAYSFSTETAVAFITAKIVASLRDTLVLFSAIGKPRAFFLFFIFFFWAHKRLPLESLALVRNMSPILYTVADKDSPSDANGQKTSQDTGFF